MKLIKHFRRLKYSLDLLERSSLSQIDIASVNIFSRSTTGLQLGHEYPIFEEQLLQANKQRNVFLLNYNIFHKMNKLLNLDIKVNFKCSYDE